MSIADFLGQWISVYTSITLPIVTSNTFSFIKQPFLPLKHALVKSNTERGISSDSPSIQLARALLESALKDVDDVSNHSSTGDSILSTATSIATTSYNGEQDDNTTRNTSLWNSNSIHNPNSDVDVSQEKDGKENVKIEKQHSRKTKSLDLSMISRPTRLHGVSRTPPTSTSSKSSNKSSTPTISGPSCTSIPKSVKSQEKETSPRINLQRNPEIQDVTRPRSKSVSILSSHSTTPSIVLTKITETSEEQSTSLLVESLLPGQDIQVSSSSHISNQPSYHSDSGDSKPKRSNSTLGRSRASSLAVIPENDRERALQDKPEAMVSSDIGSTVSSDIKEKVTTQFGNDREKKEEEEEDWEVLSIRKRRKSVKYQPTSTSNFIATLLGSPSTISSSFLTSPSSSTVRATSAKSEEHDQPPISKQLRRRTSSFKSVKNQFLNRPMPRYRRASANDAITSRNNLTTTMHQDFNKSEHIVHTLGEVIRSSPSTNLDVWSEHLQALLEETHLEEQESNSRMLAAGAGDDSGFAPSLHDSSLVSSPERSKVISHPEARDIEKGRLPRIPTLALISPMGTLRRHISCPDGILSTTSPTKKQRRPLPPLPEDLPSTIILGEGSSFSPVLPPLPPFQYDSDTQNHPEEVKERLSSSRKKSVRRKSVISNLRRQIQEQEEYVDTSLSSSNIESRRSSTQETLQSSNIDSFKTARSSQSTNLWPPPEELFASLFTSLPASPNLPGPSASGARFETAIYKKVVFSPSTKASAIFETFHSSPKSATESETPAYVYDPNTPDARKALQLVPRDLNTDLEVKPWWVVLPRFVLDDLAVGVRDWDKDRLEVYNLTRSKSRQKSI